MFRTLGLLAAATLFLTSCLVGDPRLGDLAGTPGANPSQVDLAYGTDRGCEDEVSDELCGGSQLLDIFPATGGPARGTIVWLHGGGLFAGDKSRLHSAGPVLAQLERGWSVVSVNYRLLRPRNWEPPATTTTTTTTTRPTTTTPTTTRPTTTRPTSGDVPGGGLPQDNTVVDIVAVATTPAGGWTFDAQPPPEEGYDNEYPAALQDVVAAIDWVRSHGSSYGLDTSKLVVGGHSAGGMLAAMIGLGWNAQFAGLFDITRPDAWITMAAPMDLAAWDVAQLSAAWFGPHADRMVGPLSPVRNIDAADPPGYIAHGDRDNVVNHYHANAMEFVYGLMRLAPKVRVDIVDRDSGGNMLGPGPRWHIPGDGVGMEAFNAFMDDI